MTAEMEPGVFSEGFIGSWLRTPLKVVVLYMYL
jgi:hypothetical protein